MKRIILSLLIIIACALANAENHKIYAIFVVHPGEPVIMIKETTTTGGALSGFNYKENYLRDEEGNEIVFNNFLPMLGYLEQIGWTIPDVVNQIHTNQSSTVNGRSVFLVYKEVNEKEWLEWINNGRKKKKK